MLVDFCTYLGHWPLYPLPVSNAEELLQVMDRNGIDAAFVSLVDGFFLLDPREANRRLASAVAGHRQRLHPVGTINPSLATWHADLEDAVHGLGFDGIRLHPNYHGYAASSPAATEAAHAIAGFGVPLFIAAFVDEERFQHSAIRVPPVPVTDIASLVRSACGTTIVLNNFLAEEAERLLTVSGLCGRDVYFDVHAMDKPAGGLGRLVARTGARNLVFGSQCPFLYPESTLALVAAGELAAQDADAILRHSWRRNSVLGHALDGSVH